MKRILTLLVCLLCCLLVICACDNSAVDTTEDHNTDTGTVTTEGSSEASDDTDMADTADTDYPFDDPSAYVPAETDDPSVFINIEPSNTDDKWGQVNVKP